MNLTPQLEQLQKCREWRGARLRDGYGQRWDKTKRKPVRLHRWVWEQINGPIPKGMVIMHTCDNPSCFFYDHLRLGTQAENISDMVAKGRDRRSFAGRSGELNTSAKLTAEQVVEIRAAINAGEVQRRIAERYGVSPSTIEDIKKRRRWASLEL